MSGLVSPAVRAARPVAVAAVESPASAYGVVDAIVFALDSAGLLQSPEVTAELADLRARYVDAAATVAEQALKSVERAKVENAVRDELENARARVAELEQQVATAEARVTAAVESPLAWADQLDAKSLDNFLISLGQAVEYEPIDGAIAYIHELLNSFRVAVAARGGESR